MAVVSSPGSHGHANLGPSSAARWLVCPGSVERVRGRRSPGSAASERGTRGHALAEAALRFYFEGTDFAEAWAAWDDEYPEAEDKLELSAAADEYVSVVRGLAAQYPDARVMVETLVRVPGTSDAVWGTADAIVWSRTAGVLHVCDLKLGRGVRVVAEGNHQARLYALGAINHVDPTWAKVRTVVAHIIQPARDGHTSEEIDVYDLLDYGGWVRARVEEALAPGARVVPGERQCRWCLFRDECPEYLDYRRREFFGGAGTPPAEPDPSVLRDPLLLGSYLEQAEHAREFVRAVDALGSRAVEEGSLPPGWTTRVTRRRKVTDPETLAARLHAHDVELYESVPKPLRTLQREVGPGLDLLLDGCVTVTESTRIVRDKD